MATHSSILAWRIPGTEEPGGMPSVGLHRVGHLLKQLSSSSSSTDSMVMSLSNLQETVKDKEVSHTAVHRVEKSQTGLLRTLHI